MNEPNFGQGLGSSVDARASLYAHVLTEAYRHIKTRWPTVTVVGFAAGGTSSAAPRFISLVHEKDPRVAFSYDVISLHPYIQPTAPEAKREESWGSWTIAGTLTRIRETMKSHGVASTPLWITEIGWQVSRDQGGKHNVANGLSTETQAAYSVRMNLLAARFGVARTYHMFATDTDNFNGGFYTESGPRPVALMQRAFIQLTGGGVRSIEILADGSSSGEWQYRLHCANGQSVIAAWSSVPSTVYYESASGGPSLDRAYDQDGATLDKSQLSDGRYVFVTGPNPIYLVEK